MEDILKFMQWDALHLDGVIILLVISSGFWAKKYMETINIIPAWKTLIVSGFFTLMYILLLLFSGTFQKEKLLDYFISFAVATSLYDLLIKPVIKKFFPDANFILLLIVAGSFFFSGCNPVKKVLKDPAKVELVGREWEKKNPCNNDTVKISKSDTITKLDTLYKIYTDTVINEGKQVILIKKVPESVTKIVRIRDTVNNYIVDNRRLNICNDSLTVYKNNLNLTKRLLAEQVEETKNEKHRGDKWLLYFIILAILTVGTHILRSKFKQ